MEVFPGPFPLGPLCCPGHLVERRTARDHEKVDLMTTTLTDQVKQDVAIRYGDGEAEPSFHTTEEAHENMRIIREQIADGTYDADDYEPMEVVTRTVTSIREVGEWEVHHA